MGFVGMTYLHLAGATALTAVSAEYPITETKYWPLIAGLVALALLFVLLTLQPGPLKYLVFGVYLVLLGQTLSVTAKQLGQKGLLDDGIVSVLSIFLAMSVAGFYAGDRILGFGTVLTIALLGLILGRVVFGVLGFTEAVSIESFKKGNTIVSWISTILFSIFIAYDTAALQVRARLREKKPDYVDASLGLFLDIVNLFANAEDILE